MKTIILSKELIEALNGVSTRIKRQHAAKFCCIIINKIEYDNLPLNSFVEIPKVYLVKAFNSRYSEWLSELKALGIIEEYCYGLNDGFKRVSYIVSAKKSKQYRINPALLTSNFEAFTISKEKKATDYPAIGDELKTFQFDFHKLLNSIDSIVDNKLRTLQIIDSNYPAKVLLKVRMYDKVFSLMTLDKALQIAADNNMVVIKDKRKIEIANLEQYLERKKTSSEFFINKSIKRLIEQDFEPSRNNSNYRLDYLFTNMNKQLLSIILNDNHKSEIDLSNSQFSIFINLLNTINNQITLQDTDNIITYNYVNTFFKHPVVACVLEKFKATHSYYVNTFLDKHQEIKPCYVNTFLNDFKKECELFSNLCFDGGLYSFVNKKLKIGDGKLLMMEIAFSKENNHSTNKMELKRHFPHIIGFIDCFKKLYGYKQFSISLQQTESILFIDTLLPAVQTQYSCLPKHDSLIVATKDVAQVMEIVKSIFDEINFKYQFKIDEKVENTCDRLCTAIASNPESVVSLTAIESATENKHIIQTTMKSEIINPYTNGRKAVPDNPIDETNAQPSINVAKVVSMTNPYLAKRPKLECKLKDYPSFAEFYNSELRWAFKTDAEIRQEYYKLYPQAV